MTTKKYIPKNIVLNSEQKKELDKITNEIIDRILSKAHKEGQHNIDKKLHCPLCIQEQLKPAEVKP